MMLASAAAANEARRLRRARRTPFSLCFVHVHLVHVEPEKSEVGQTGLLLGDCHGVVSRASP
jgi:hypothetical protein